MMGLGVKNWSGWWVVSEPEPIISLHGSLGSEGCRLSPQGRTVCNQSLRSFSGTAQKLQKNQLSLQVRRAC